MSEIIFDELMMKVERPARYVGDEWNAIKKQLDRVEIKVALAFPDVYEIGMSYLGQKILYDLLNRNPEIAAERVYTPWLDYEEFLRISRQPIRSLENKLPLSEFDIIGFSLLYELNYTNILTMLDLAGVPILSSERNEKDPLVIAGGPAVFNPEPLADIFDLFVIGDGEEAFPEIISVYKKARQKKLSRRELLFEFIGVQGVYIPSLYELKTQADSPLVYPVPAYESVPEVVSKRVYGNFTVSTFPEKVIVPNLRAVFDRVAVEAARGCPQSCRFCQAASIYFPYRIKSPEALWKTLLEGLRSTGYEDASLCALSIGDYPFLEEVVKKAMASLAEKKISLSLSSLRPGLLSRELVQSILKVRKTGFTLVPEAGTEKLRAVINKNLTDDDLEEALRYAFDGGWKLVKLYFMIGLPGENEPDIEGIVSLVKRSLELGRKLHGRWPRINLSLSSFIPKPHTPFQWLGMETEDSLREKQIFLRNKLRNLKSVELKEHNLKSSIIEAVFSRGDRRLTGVLTRAWSHGARYDGWSGQLNWEAWKRAFDESSVNLKDYLQSIPFGAILPWEHIRTGLKKAYLLQELNKAFRAEKTPVCSDRNCSDCDGCELRSWKNSIPKSEFSRDAITERWKLVGEKKSVLTRYKAVYSKTGRARFLSHIDVINVLQRAFRRAGFAVKYTSGFHPLPDFSYGPALPLGMEGLNEVLEFKSEYNFSEEEFIARINLYLPPGIKFKNLGKLPENYPKLQALIKRLVYSVDIGEICSRKVKAHPEKFQQTSAIEARQPNIAQIVERLRSLCPDRSDVEAHIESGRLFLSLNPALSGNFKPQELISKAFGIDQAVYFLRRDLIQIEAPDQRRFDTENQFQ